MFYAGKFSFDLSRPKIMGILNVTPDSFSDGGRYTTLDKALFHAENLLKAGADIIDIGAESTRPGTAWVDAKTELARLAPVIEALISRFDCCISIDTNKPEVMHEVLALGAALINDVRGFVVTGALETVAKTNAGICIMHMRGSPDTMQQFTEYDDLITEVRDFLYQQADKAIQLGIDKNRILIDPGFGFSKTVTQNLQLVKNISAFSRYPLLMGLSRKSTLGEILKDKNKDRDVASVAGALLSVINGAKIVRVHDVAKTREALDVYEAVLMV